MRYLPCMEKKRSKVKANPSRAKNPRPGNGLNVRDMIWEAYAAHWTEEGHAPSSVARFCKQLGITEAVFFKHFPTLAAVEKSLWRQWISGIISAVEDGSDWAEFSSRERYLAFLFAFTQSAAERRTLLMERFHEVSPVSHPAALEGMRSEFLEFAQRLIDHGT